MSTTVRLLLVGALLSLVASLAFAQINTGDDDNPYADCMNGCWKSHKYCQEHQSAQVDCNHQLGVCIEYCESEYDPQSDWPGRDIFLPSPPPKMLRTTP